MHRDLPGDGSSVLLRLAKGKVRQSHPLGNNHGAMLRLGLILVALAGVAELLLSAGGILVGVGLGGSLVTDLWPLVGTLVAALFGLWGTAVGSIWGPLLVAASSIGWTVIAALNIGSWQAALFAVATALAIVVAPALWRTRPPKR